SALAVAAAQPGRRAFLRRARARHGRLPGHRRSWSRHRQHPRRRQVDGRAQALFHLPAVADERAVRAPSRGRRSR
nr:hypothetical protein [Tanacetum cinerariifolium]